MLWAGKKCWMNLAEGRTRVRELRHMAGRLKMLEPLLQSTTTMRFPTVFVLFPCGANIGRQMRPCSLLRDSSTIIYDGIGRLYWSDISL